jgi:hypothetical protein
VLARGARDGENLQTATAPPPESVTVTPDLDVDILTWLKALPTDGRRVLHGQQHRPLPPAAGA